MCLERQSRRGLLGAVGVVDGVVRGADGELAADCQVGIVGQLAGRPGGEAVRVAVVGALGGVGVGEEGAVEVHLFAGVVFVDVLSVAGDFVGGVLDGVDAPCGWVLGDADGVAETPA